MWTDFEPETLVAPPITIEMLLEAVRLCAVLFRSYQSCQLSLAQHQEDRTYTDGLSLRRFLGD